MKQSIQRTYHHLIHMTPDDIAEVNFTIFRSLARVSQPLVLFGLTYWVVIHIGGYPLPTLPWFDVAWPYVQIVAIATHLAILPNYIATLTCSGREAELPMPMIALALTACSLLCVGQLDAHTITLIRMLALVSIVLIEPEPRHVVLTLVTAPLDTTEQDEDEEEEYHPFAPTRRQD